MIKYKDDYLQKLAKRIDLIGHSEFIVRDDEGFDMAIFLPDLTYPYAWEEKGTGKHWENHHSYVKVRFKENEDTKKQLEAFLDSKETQERIENRLEVVMLPRGIDKLREKTDILDFPFLSYVPDDTDTTPEEKITYKDEFIDATVRGIKESFIHEEKEEVDICIGMPYLGYTMWWNDEKYEGDPRFHKVHFKKNEDIRKQLEEYLYSDETQSWVKGYIEKAASQLGKEIIKERTK